VKYAVAPDGTLMPYRIDVDDEEYAAEVLRSRELYPGRWRYTVKVKEREMYLHREGDEWWVE
jgi:hypothetical protein